VLTPARRGPPDVGGVPYIQDAETPQTRQRRITNLITTIGGQPNTDEGAVSEATADRTPAPGQPGS